MSGAAKGYDGVHLLSSDEVVEAFRPRMQCQCREIERYRQHALSDGGRELTLDEAAMEWIDRYAADFARDNTFSFD